MTISSSCSRSDAAAGRATATATARTARPAASRPAARRRRAVFLVHPMLHPPSPPAIAGGNGPDRPFRARREVTGVALFLTNKFDTRSIIPPPSAGVIEKAPGPTGGSGAVFLPGERSGGGSRDADELFLEADDVGDQLAAARVLDR